MPHFHFTSLLRHFNFFFTFFFFANNRTHMQYVLCQYGYALIFVPTVVKHLMEFDFFYNLPFTDLVTRYQNPSLLDYFLECENVNVIFFLAWPVESHQNHSNNKLVSKIVTFYPTCPVSMSIASPGFWHCRYEHDRPWHAGLLHWDWQGLPLLCQISQIIAL